MSGLGRVSASFLLSNDSALGASSSASSDIVFGISTKLCTIVMLGNQLL